MQNNDEQNTGISKSLLLLNIVMVICIATISIAIFTTSKSKEIVEVLHEKQVELQNPFLKVLVGAKSAYVYDVSADKVLYKKNEFVQLPLASITKLMTALVASENMPLDSKVIVKNEFLREEGDSGLLVNEPWVLKNLIDFSLLVSSNDGARSIASVVGEYSIGSDDFSLGRKTFISKMNDKARELDLKQTYFINESGLDEGNSSGGYGSAIDVAKLVQYILKSNPTLLEATKYQSAKIDSISKTHTAKNTNIDVDTIPGLLASKTGFTDMAGGNLVIAFDVSVGHPIIVVVLGSTIDGRFEDVQTLVKTSREYIDLSGI